MSKAAEQEVKSTAVGANLIEEEKMEIGGVKWEVYSYYAKSIGFLARRRCLRGGGLKQTSDTSYSAIPTIPHSSLSVPLLACQTNT